MHRICCPRTVSVTLVLALTLSLAVPAPAESMGNPGESRVEGLGSAVIMGIILGGVLVLVGHLRRGPIRATPSELEFEGTATPGTVTLVNRGKRPVTIVSLDLSSTEAFTIQRLPVALPATLLPDESLVVGIDFAPPSAGSHASDLSVTTHDDRGRERRLRINVRGTAP